MNKEITQGSVQHEIFPGRVFTGAVPSADVLQTKLRDELNYKFANFFSARQVTEIVDAFYAAKADWVSGFGGEQYSLGEAWYHYVETGKGGNPAEYLDRAVLSRQIVERHVPGLHDYILSFMRKLYPDKHAKIRESWAGPGIVNFLANNHVARRGGVIHVDTDGLTNTELLDPDFVVYSFVAVLQKPETGGDLRLWNYRFDYDAGEEVLNNPEMLANVKRARIIYEPGNLHMFEGLKAHKIEPFEGEKDRVCLTFHAALRNNVWEIWF